MDERIRLISRDLPSDVDTTSVRPGSVPAGPGDREGSYRSFRKNKSGCILEPKTSRVPVTRRLPPRQHVLLSKRYRARHRPPFAIFWPRCWSLSLAIGDRAENPRPARAERRRGTGIDAPM